MNRLLIIFAGFLLIFSCKREENTLPQIEGVPELYFSGEIGGTGVKLEAGKEDYYNFSSYTNLGDTLYEYESNLSKIDCNNCSNSLRVKLRDFTVNSASGNPVDIFAVDTPSFSASTITFSIDSLSIQAIPEVYSGNSMWYLNGNFASSDSILSFPLTSSGQYTVLLAHTDTSCVDSLSNSVYYDGLNVPCTAGISTNMSGTTFFAFANDSMVPPFQYRWFEGQDPTQTLSVDSVFDMLNLTFSTICVEITDSENCSDIHCYPTDISPCSSAFNLVPVVHQFNFNGGYSIFGTIFIEWVDENGELWISDPENPNAAGTISIQSVVAYLENENSEETFRMVATISCALFNADGEEIFLKNGKFNLAFGMP